MICSVVPVFLVQIPDKMKRDTFIVYVYMRRRKIVVYQTDRPFPSSMIPFHLSVCTVSRRGGRVGSLRWTDGHTHHRGSCIHTQNKAGMTPFFRFKCHPLDISFLCVHTHTHSHIRTVKTMKTTLLDRQG